MQVLTVQEAGGMAIQKHRLFVQMITTGASAPKVMLTAPVQAESVILVIPRQQKIVATIPMRRALMQPLRGSAITV